MVLYSRLTMPGNRTALFQGKLAIVLSHPTPYTKSVALGL
jgi:hypothetical protein